MLLCSVRPVSSALRQSLQALQAQHEAQLAATGVIARQKSMINLGSEFYARAVVYVRERGTQEQQQPQCLYRRMLQPLQRLLTPCALCCLCSLLFRLVPIPLVCFWMWV